MIEHKSKPLLDSIRYKGPAVYKIRIVKNNKPFELKRLGNNDKDGILYIGQTTDFKRRIRDFFNGPHSGGELYRIIKVDGKLRGKMGDYKLHVKFLKLNRNQLKNVEAQELLNYTMKYCEPPPINSSMPMKAWDLKVR